MKKSFSVFVFRHGATTDNLGGKFSGRRNVKLTKKGWRDAEMVALRLKNKKFKVAFHSSLIRSRQTLKEVLKFHPECQWLVEDDRIIERSYGTLQGKTHLEILKKKGAKQYDLWHRGFDHPSPKGESYAMVEKRVRSFVKDLKEFIKVNQCNVAISAHGNSIRLLKKVMEGLSREETTTLFIPYDNYLEYSVEVKV